MSDHINRQAPGTPTGGQFAPKQRAEADVDPSSLGGFTQPADDGEFFIHDDTVDAIEAVMEARSAEHLDTAVTDARFEVRTEAAFSPYLSETQTEVLSSDPEWIVRWATAHRQDHANVVRRLANDSDPRVRLMMVESPHLSDDEANALRSDPEVSQLLGWITDET